MTEHPQNVRSSRIIERGFPNTGHHSRRLTPAARTEDNQINRSYHNGGHRSDDAQQRSSRVGRHHQDGAGNRW